MFGIFKKTDTPSSPTKPKEDIKDPATESLLRAIEEKKKEDPLAGLKIGANEVNNRLFSALKNENGVNVDVALRVLSALAGFSCQMAIREEIIHKEKASEKDALMTVKTKDGVTYYMGRLLNRPLAEDKYSVWGLISGAVQEAGGKIPDLQEAAEYGAKTIGSENFGKPRVEEKHLVGDTSQNYVQGLWPKLVPIIDMFCDDPFQRPILLSIAISSLIQQAKGVLDPTTAGILCFDTAVATSKIDPTSIGLTK